MKSIKEKAEELYRIPRGDDTEDTVALDLDKSLRPQNRWKPSDEQMRILDLAIRGGINHGTREETTLVSLLNDLKKLKEK